jgi:hypothetical protein
VKTFHSLNQITIPRRRSAALYVDNVHLAEKTCELGEGLKYHIGGDRTIQSMGRSAPGVKDGRSKAAATAPHLKLDVPPGYKG